MTQALSERMDAIESFAADVAHEIRNPLTSIRSAVETLDLVKEPGRASRLLDILKQDVGRLDRLVTDISNASRLDAELSRDPPQADRPRQLLTRHRRPLPGDLAARSTPPVRFAPTKAWTPRPGHGPRGPARPGVPQPDRQRPLVQPAGGAVRVSLARRRWPTWSSPSRTTARASRPRTSRRCSSASTPPGRRARRSAATRAWACPSPGRSSRPTTGESGPRTGWPAGEVLGARFIVALPGRKAMTLPITVHAGLIAAAVQAGLARRPDRGPVRRGQERPGAAPARPRVPPGRRRPGGALALERGAVRPRARSLRGLIEARGLGILTVRAGPFGPVDLVVRCETETQVDRMPEPGRLELVGEALPLLALMRWKPRLRENSAARSNGLEPAPMGRKSRALCAAGRDSRKCMRFGARHAFGLVGRPFKRSV